LVLSDPLWSQEWSPLRHTECVSFTVSPAFSNLTIYPRRSVVVTQLVAEVIGHGADVGPRPFLFIDKQGGNRLFPMEELFDSNKMVVNRLTTHRIRVNPRTLARVPAELRGSPVGYREGWSTYWSLSWVAAGN
jgi:hypothetical protein